MTTVDPGRERALALTAVVGLLAVFWSQFAWVSPTNFDGYDEWLVHDLASKGILAYPNSNRPLAGLWALPGFLLSPASFTGHFVAHTTYLWLSGLAVWFLCRRLVPGQPVLAFLAATFTLAWAPADLGRLNAVGMTPHSGSMFGTLAAIVFLVESWRRRSVALLLAGAAAAFVSIRSYEAVVPTMLCAPLLLLATAQGPRRPIVLWTLPWVGASLLATALALWPMLFPAPGTDYQRVRLGVDHDPWAVTARLLRLFQDHLAPLGTTPPSQLSVVAVPVAVLVFAAACVLLLRLANESSKEPASTGVRRLLLALAAAGLAYLPYALTPSTATAMRTQFLASCGIGWCLAECLLLLSRVCPARFRALAIVALAAWPVAVGTGRVVDLQKQWDRVGRFEIQRSLLAQLTAKMPDLEPGTLVLLIDKWPAFPADFTFRHAVEFLYRGRASGHSPSAWPLFYPTAMDGAGIRCEPWPDLQAAWRERPSLHRYDQVVVVRFTTAGNLRIEDEWPDTLPPLPAGARYAPRERILEHAAPSREHALVRGGT